MGDMGIRNSRPRPTIWDCRDIWQLSEKVGLSVLKGGGASSSSLPASGDQLDTAIKASIAGDFWVSSQLSQKEARAGFRFLVLEAMLSKVEDTKKSIEILNLMGSIIFTDEVQAEVPFQDVSDVQHEIYTALQEIERGSKLLGGSKVMGGVKKLRSQLRSLTQDPVLKDDLDGLFKEFLVGNANKIRLQNCILSLL